MKKLFFDTIVPAMAIIAAFALFFLVIFHSSWQLTAAVLSFAAILLFAQSNFKKSLTWLQDDKSRIVNTYERLMASLREDLAKFQNLYNNAAESSSRQAHEIIALKQELEACKKASQPAPAKKSTRKKA